MIIQLLNKGLVAKAFAILRKRASVYPGEGFSDRLEALQTEFQYMSDFMLQGYKDEKRAALFHELMQRIVDLDYDIQVRETLLEDPYVKGAVKALGAYDLSVEALQNRLLEPVGTQEHFDYLSAAFLSLLTSVHWRQQEADDWSAFIASPTTKDIDAVTLTGAVMMSAIYHYSYYKLQCLADIYLLSRKDEVRQRAFVGCMLAMCDSEEQSQEQTATLLKKIFSTGEAGKMLIEMQIQMAACTNAEADSTEINKNIMPGLIRNQPFRFTKDGIVEKGEENDCINLDADERRMDAMTEGVEKMIQMQKNGSDIFFGGFRQMKRFPFFSKMANWFMPFTVEHPDIGKEISAINSSGFVGKMTERGPFCNSDKYSFVIAMAGVLGHLPENMRTMIEEGQVGPLGMQEGASATPSASLTRLQFLQDLYRYSRLNPTGTSLRDPFAVVPQYRLWLVARDWLTDAERKSVCTCMLRDTSLWRQGATQQQGHEAVAVGAEHPVTLMLDSFKDKESFEYLSCRADCMMLWKRYDEAAVMYGKCLKIKLDEPSAMRGMARACYGQGEYAKAAFYFDALHTLFPKRVSYSLNYVMSMVMDGDVESVVNDMYKLEYENPDNQMVKNTLGWVLLHAQKPEQALAVYGKLVEANAVTGDFSMLMNAFYAFLVNGKARKGVEMLNVYCMSLDGEQQQHFPDMVADAMRDDAGLLAKYSIGKAEKAIILSQFAFLTL